MTNERFDELTKALSRTASRRTVFKGIVVAAVGGALTRLRGGGDAEARARVKMACARIGQPCNTIAGTPGNKICCPHLTCDTDLTCCKPTNQSCVDDGDCCANDVCRPNPSGLGNRCLPPGDVGAECLEDADCMGGLGCDAYTGTCEHICDGVTCTTDQTCCGDPYIGTVCCGGLNAACDTGLDACVSCMEYGEPCASDLACCDNLRDGNAICGHLPTDNAGGGPHVGLPEISGACCVPNGGSCQVGPCCADSLCDTQEICRGHDGTACAINSDCLSGFCDSVLNMCCDAYTGCV